MCMYVCMYVCISQNRPKIIWIQNVPHTVVCLSSHLPYLFIVCVIRVSLVLFSNFNLSTDAQRTLLNIQVLLLLLFIFIFCFFDVCLCTCIKCVRNKFKDGQVQGHGLLKNCLKCAVLSLPSALHSTLHTSNV